MQVRIFISAILISAFYLNVSAFTRASGITVRRAEKIGINWKFFKGAPAGTPSDNTYDDAAWSTVCIPHSIDYVEPTQEAEQASYEGVAWYRRPITVSGEAGKKYFLEFHGAMQATDVWVNGVKAGSHYTSGYTGFSYDITAQMAGATTANCAVKLDNTRSLDIPPGRDGNAPDFFLFSGLYRDVYLITTGTVYIPFCGQLITTPTVSASSGTVRVRTTVRNDGAAPANCTVVTAIRDQSGKDIGIVTGTASISAGDAHEFDLTSDAISGIQLWSPATPTVYHTYTTVSVDGAYVDDYASTFGFRTMEWSTTEGFILNGTRCPVEGVCEHQSFAWVQNAVPTTRWPVEMAFIKDAGYNAIRCSHYPRDPAFYDAADSMGLLLEVEVPSWGYGASSYTPLFWSRLDTCAMEMVLQGYNHPSIFLWGIFNEPFADFSAPDQLPAINATVHRLDETRATMAANNSTLGGNVENQDVIGLNYQTIATFGLPNSQNYKFITTEYFEGWNYNCTRGEACESKFSDDGWNAYQVAANQPHQHAGQFLWVYNDYSALWNPGKPMGLVDEYRLPKKLYYRFRSAFTDKPSDTASAGTATKVVLTPDLPRLKADGADFTIVTVALRDDNNILREHAANTNVTFTVSGPATAFGNLTRVVKAGKAAIVLRATTETGTITLAADVAGLTPASVDIPCVSPEVAVRKPKPAGLLRTGISPVAIRTCGDVISISAGGELMERVSLLDVAGKTIGVWHGASSVAVKRRTMATNVYIVQVIRNGMTTTKKLFSVDR
jgi:beta-galactosidase